MEKEDTGLAPPPARAGDTAPVPAISEAPAPLKVQSEPPTSPKHDRPGRFGIGAWLSRRMPFRRLLGRIVLINLIAIVPFVAGVYYVTAGRNSLLDERIKALMGQARIIASALADEATSEETDPPMKNEEARQIINALARPAGVRARLFGLDGEALVDTRFLLPRNQVVTVALPPPGQSMTFDRALWMLNNAVYEFIAGRRLPLYLDGPNVGGRAYSEVEKVLEGAEEEFSLRVNANGELIVSVALPVKRLATIRAALMLSTEAGDLNDAQRQDALMLFYTALAALILLVVLSYALSRDIAWPVRRLAEAAQQVRRGETDVTVIPTMSWSADELKELSASLRDMTEALQSRLDAIEQFAADVAHEIKNPLTSMRSAIETMARTEDETRRKKLMALIQNDVRRIDRLISDISEASRLDAELSREKAAALDLSHLVSMIVSLYQDQDPPLPVRFVTDGLEQAARVQGREGALAQVFRNIIDNAISFSPEGGTIRVRMRRQAGEVVVAVEDEGPGIPDESLEKVFERFYTHRPAGHGFGKNSGLGLAISKQIVLTHGGTIAATNRPADSGAVFTVTLPMG